jgi:hypothetical protein
MQKKHRVEATTIADIDDKNEKESRVMFNMISAKFFIPSQNSKAYNLFCFRNFYFNANSYALPPKEWESKSASKRTIGKYSLKKINEIVAFIFFNKFGKPLPFSGLEADGHWCETVLRNLNEFIWSQVYGSELIPEEKAIESAKYFFKEPEFETVEYNKINAFKSNSLPGIRRQFFSGFSVELEPKNSMEIPENIKKFADERIRLPANDECIRIRVKREELKTQLTTVFTKLCKYKSKRQSLTEKTNSLVEEITIVTDLLPRDLAEVAKKALLSEIPKSEPVFTPIKELVLSKFSHENLIDPEFVIYETQKEFKEVVNDMLSSVNARAVGPTGGQSPGEQPPGNPPPGNQPMDNNSRGGQLPGSQRPDNQHMGSNPRGGQDPGGQPQGNKPSDNNNLGGQPSGMNQPGLSTQGIPPKNMQPGNEKPLVMQSSNNKPNSDLVGSREQVERVLFIGGGEKSNINAFKKQQTSKNEPSQTPLKTDPKIIHTTSDFKDEKRYEGSGIKVTKVNIPEDQKAFETSSNASLKGKDSKESFHRQFSALQFSQEMLVGPFYAPNVELATVDFQYRNIQNVRETEKIPTVAYALFKWFCSHKYKFSAFNAISENQREELLIIEFFITQKKKPTENVIKDFIGYYQKKNFKKAVSFVIDLFNKQRPEVKVIEWRTMVPKFFVLYLFMNANRANLFKNKRDAEVFIQYWINTVDDVADVYVNQQINVNDIDFKHFVFA